MIESKEEFEQGYAERSGIALQELRELGGHAERCECGDDICRGWVMVTQPEGDDLERAVVRKELIDSVEFKTQEPSGRVSDKVWRDNIKHYMV